MDGDNTTRLRAVSTNIPDDIYQALVSEAFAEDRKLAAHIRRILRQHVDQLRRPLAYEPPAMPAPWPTLPATPVTWEPPTSVGSSITVDNNDEGLQ